MKAIITAIAGVFLAAFPAHSALTINWSNEFGVSNYDSTGAALTSSFNYTLGTFDTSGGWSPTVANAAQWESRWSAIGTGGYNEGLGYFAGTNVLANNNTFAAGSQAYVWVYNTTTPSGTAEWFLATDDNSDGNSLDNWEIPVITGTQHDLSTDWVIACSDPDSLNVIMGGLAGVQGDGYYEDHPADFCIQTASFATVVPEPGGALLLASTGFIFILRRRRL